MPGIAGILASAPSPAHEAAARRMIALMHHGPDPVSGFMFAPELGVYGGWVAHAGSYAARQSAASGGPTRLVFTGECFERSNAARTALLRDNHDLQADGFARGLNGLFAGLVVDTARGRARLFNDRFSGERLYVYEKDGVLYFASEAKALLAVLPELRQFDDVGVAHFLAFGSTLDGHTLFRGLRLMPGGSIWTFSPGVPVRRERYFTPAEWECLPQLSDAEFEDRFAATFRALLPAYASSTQPLALSLTGGLDTRMIMACLPRDQMPRMAYTYAAEGGDSLLDLTIAQRVAGMRGITHHVLQVGAEFLGSFGRQLDRTVFVTDGCAGTLGAHEIYLSEQARRYAPVRLTGNFGSEVLRSMSTFKRNGAQDGLLDPALVVRVNAVVEAQRARSVHAVTHAAFQETPWHLFGTMAASRSQLSFRTPYLDNEVVELAYRAPPQLRHTTGPALRLIHNNDAELATVPTDRGVAWGADGVRARLHRMLCSVTFKLDYWHKEGLPDALTPLDSAIGLLSHTGLLGLHKFLAYRAWFRRELAPYAAQVTHDSRTRGLPFWNPAALRTIASDHQRGRSNRLRDLHAVLTLEAVHRTLIDDAAYASHANAIA